MKRFILAAVLALGLVAGSQTHARANGGFGFGIGIGISFSGFCNKGGDCCHGGNCGYPGPGYGYPGPGYGYPGMMMPPMYFSVPVMPPYQYAPVIAGTHYYPGAY